MRRLLGLDEADVPISRIYPTPARHGEPPTVPEFPLGTWTVDQDKVRYQLRNLRVDDPRLVFPEGLGRSQMALDFAKWIERGHMPPPLLVAENPDGKLVVLDGHHRASALRIAGIKDTKAWVAPVEYWDTLSGPLGYDIEDVE